MENYVFVCIGTDLLIEDSFGPRVGDMLKEHFESNKNIKVFGTMKSPVHFLNAPIFLDYLKEEKNKLILIDSALGKTEQIGTTYFQRGGIEIGKAFGKSFYFPARWNIKTVVGTKESSGTYEVKYINQLAKDLVSKITKNSYEII